MKDTYYEVDFADDNNLWQVCWKLTDDNSKRELYFVKNQSTPDKYLITYQNDASVIDKNIELVHRLDFLLS
jgi:predicted AAA+ superfamily ATPase